MTEATPIQAVVSSDEVLPDENSDTRKKVRKTAAIGLGLCAALLLVDDLVRRFQRRKNVTVAVAGSVDDKPAS